MEHLYESPVVDQDKIRQNNLLRGQLGIRAYQIATGNYTAPLGRQFAMNDMALVYEAIDAIPNLVDGQQVLPIEEFSK